MKRQHLTRFARRRGGFAVPKWGTNTNRSRISEHSYMKTAVLLVLMAALLFAGCSHSPVPNAKNFAKSEQNLFQAAHHWERLADQQAEKLMPLACRISDLYIDPGNYTTPFGMAYHSLLESKLALRGVRLLDKKVPGALVITYQIQVIRHPRQGSATHDLNDYADSVFYKREAEEQNVEILITTTGTKQGHILMSDSQLYYIFPENVGNYLQVPEPCRVFKVTKG